MFTQWLKWSGNYVEKQLKKKKVDNWLDLFFLLLCVRCCGYFIEPVQTKLISNEIRNLVIVRKKNTWPNFKTRFKMKRRICGQRRETKLENGFETKHVDKNKCKSFLLAHGWLLTFGNEILCIAGKGCKVK